LLLGIKTETVTELQAWRKIKETVKKIKEVCVTAVKIADKHITVSVVITQNSYNRSPSLRWNLVFDWTDQRHKACKYITAYL